ncbi:hydrogenase expression/formation protein HypE [Inmirania thermothiophila]|uniref:Hydrogenase expression/formation protein HypE n=1 Tax=Inmirania thermothiophila TaxID=1750597 RepID=A0A3N1Y115_9GAMM|nr:hydrogenase expression/formation protein HypE [Inmirania thermothiophila]ROR32524.1 hydrogenase expression/formation protein HypE [Inmirania thermothiophila]
MRRSDYGRPLDLRRGVVEMAHGGGGRAMAQLIEELFLHHLDPDAGGAGDDFAVLALPPGRVVMATDAHVVTPRFFPGGDIGALAVHGTVNDVAMAGARPLHLAASFVLEEGLPLAELERIVASMAAAAREAGVRIVTGDTKVVERGKADGLYITTTGVGVVPEGVEIGGARARPGDAVLVSGPVGDHGIAILAARGELGFEVPVRSDTQPLADLVAAMVAAVPQLRCLRDATRGGVAAVLNEIARQSGVGIRLREEAVPVRPEVAAACEFLGLDPLHVACEGRLVAVCPGDRADALLAAMRAHPRGREAAMVGVVVEDAHHFVQMETRFGGSRIVDWLHADQLPRIC